MTPLPKTKSLLLDQDEGWLTIWLNTPNNRNALSSTLSQELLNVLKHVKGDLTVRGLTLRGKGGVFCAGGDLKEFGTAFEGGDNALENIKTSNLKGGELFSTINSMPQIVVAIVEGAAIAGGLGIACCADIVLVMNDAKFSLTETQLGIVPAQIAPYVVQRFGYTTARRLMLTGARFNGSDAIAFGLADGVASGESELETMENEIKISVQKCGPAANAATKAILLESQLRSPDEMQEYSAGIFASCLMSEEGREGISAFIEKRKPRWAE